jgi:hypothetical protein
MPKKMDTEMKSAVTLAWIFLAVLVALVLLVFWPWTKQFVGLEDPPKVEALGYVHDVAYVGGISPRTQVRTGSRTLLLYETAEIANGTAIERRTFTHKDLLCIVGSSHCFKIMSH